MERVVPLASVVQVFVLLGFGRQALSDDGCAGYHLNERQTICCDGIVYIRSGFRQACCGSVAYDPQHYMCCGSTIVHREGRKPGCCGSQGYDAYAERCEDGYVVDRTGVGSTCCLTAGGWTCCRRGEHCCSSRGDLATSRRGDVPGFRPACCPIASRSERAQCCRAATERAWFLPPCCDADDVRPTCCVGPDSGEWQCCTPDEGYCCDRDGIPVRPPSRRPGRLPARAPPRRLPEGPPRFVTAALELPRRPTAAPERRPSRFPAPAPRPRPTLRPRPTPAAPPASRATPPGVPDCCVGPRQPACCFTVFRWTTCCQTVRRSRPRQPKPNKAPPTPASRSCCVGPTRPTCCYDWNRASDCCGDDSPASSNATARRRGETTTSDERPQEQRAPFEGQIASCCSSSSRRQCCAYGRKVTGTTPTCCDDGALTDAGRGPAAGRPAPSGPQFRDFVDYSDDRVITAIEEDLSCCGLAGDERRACCANGYLREGYQRECCGPDMDEEIVASHDIPIDMAYLYAADEPEQAALMSCCDVTAADREPCCRSGYLSTGQAFACCEDETTSHGKEDHGMEGHGKDDHGKEDHGMEDPVKEDHGKEDHGMEDHSKEDHGKEDRGVEDHDKEDLIPDKEFISWLWPADSPIDDSKAKKPSCCNLETLEREHCCSKQITAECCPFESNRSHLPEVGRGPEGPPNERIALDCCGVTDEPLRRRCCRTEIPGHRHHALCCPGASPKDKKHQRERRRHTHRGFRLVVQRTEHRLSPSVGVCGTEPYDTAVYMCCSGRLTVRQGTLSECCGQSSYDAAIYQCCPGDRIKRYC